MATLADMLRQGADRLVELPNDARRFMTNPQAFTQLVTGKNAMPRETGFAAGAMSLPPTEMSVLDPNQAPYMQGYEQGEPFGIASMVLPVAAPAALATAKALAPTAGRMAENYMVKQGFMPSIVPQGADNTITSAERMAIAQRNAALPVSEGGLGLPANNTAAQRAEAMGYNLPVYHGTNADISAFDVTGKGKTAGAGSFFTTNPITAETYVSSSGGGNILPLLLKQDDFLTANARGRGWADIYTNQLAAKSGKTRYTPQELGLDINSATTTDELGIIANELGKKGVKIKNVKDLGPNSHVMRAKEYLLQKYGIVPDPTWSNVTGSQHQEAQRAMTKLYDAQKSDIYAIQDPALIRSRFAAFDPKQASNPNLLAGGLAIPIVDEDNRKAMLEKLFNSQ
jgi:hypothetical protein